jgi:hypothetical protein
VLQDTPTWTSSDTDAFRALNMTILGTNIAMAVNSLLFHHTMMLSNRNVKEGRTCSGGHLKSQKMDKWNMLECGTTNCATLLGPTAYMLRLGTMM